MNNRYLKHISMLACILLALVVCESPDRKSSSDIRTTGTKRDIFLIMKDIGVNTIRLRIWVDPVSGGGDFCGKKSTLEMAKRIKANGFLFMLDFHYSNFWADPQNQRKPQAWAKNDYEKLKKDLYAYTVDILRSCARQGTYPDLIQIGNEIEYGMVWNDGRVSVYDKEGQGYNRKEQWDNLVGFLKEGIRAVNDTKGKRKTKIILHISPGGNNFACRTFFDNIVSRGVQFDIIGLSYYPWWHGSFIELKNNINSLSDTYGKDVLVVETSYPWTLQNFDAEKNWVEKGKDLLSGYPATLDGQRRYLDDLIENVRSAKNNRGLGVCYWGPELPVQNSAQTTPADNLALFSNYHVLLPSAYAMTNQIRGSIRYVGADISFIPEIEALGGVFYK